ncbi:hypothetical protein EMIT0P258_50062 [Pseudomonas sp. IT-P258]
MQGRPFKVADCDVKPTIVLLRRNQNNYSISIVPVDDADVASGSRLKDPQESSIGLAGKLPGRLCLAESLCHDDPTAG